MLIYSVEFFQPSRFPVLAVPTSLQIHSMSHVHCICNRDLSQTRPFNGRNLALSLGFFGRSWWEGRPVLGEEMCPSYLLV